MNKILSFTDAVMVILVLIIITSLFGFEWAVIISLGTAIWLLFLCTKTAYTELAEEVDSLDKRIRKLESTGEKLESDKK